MLFNSDSIPKVENILKFSVSTEYDNKISVGTESDNDPEEKKESL
jgi:hypothetical protein